MPFDFRDRIGFPARSVGGITGEGSKNVNPVYRNTTDAIQKNSVKVVKPARTQEQINAEGIANARKALNKPAKPTTQDVIAKEAREMNRLRFGWTSGRGN